MWGGEQLPVPVPGPVTHWPGRNLPVPRPRFAVPVPGPRFALNLGTSSHQPMAARLPPYEEMPLF
eukprot:1554279-Rhodomonas_salina.1